SGLLVEFILVARPLRNFDDDVDGLRELRTSFQIMPKVHMRFRHFRKSFLSSPMISWLSGVLIAFDKYFTPFLNHSRWPGVILRRVALSVLWKQLIALRYTPPLRGGWTRLQ